MRQKLDMTWHATRETFRATLDKKFDAFEFTLDNFILFACGIWQPKITFQSRNV
jgi:hypothetical protein